MDNVGQRRKYYQRVRRAWRDGRVSDRAMRQATWYLLCALLDSDTYARARNVPGLAHYVDFYQSLAATASL